MSEDPQSLIEFQCPNCSKRLKAKSKAAGRQVACPRCNRRFTLALPSDRRLTLENDQVTEADHGSEVQPGFEVAIDADAQWHQSPQHSDQADASKSASNSVTGRSIFDDQDLQLENLAIEDIDQRHESSKAIRDEKDSQRRRHQAKQKPPSHGATEMPGPVTSRSGNPSAVEKLQDEYTFLDDSMNAAPEEHPSASVKPAQVVAASTTQQPPAKSIFDDDLPNLVDLEKSANPAVGSLDSLENMPSVVGTNLSALLPELEDLQLQPLPEASPKLDEPTQFQYRVACPGCGTQIYVNQGAEGTKTKCPDCFTIFKVPRPPANWKPSHVSVRHNTFDSSAPLTGDSDATIQEIDRRRQQRTQAMLELAESELENERYSQRDFGQDFDTASFIQGTFGFLKDPMAVGFCLGYSLLISIVFAAIHHGTNDESKIFLVPAAALVGLITLLPMFSAAMALLESVANRQLRVSQWPGFNVYEYAADIFVVASSAIAGALPGYLLGLWLGGDLDGSGRIQINGAMLSTFILFPVFLISMLDNGSAFQPVSWDVLRSMKLAAEAWAGYYLKTLIAFAGTMLCWYLLLGQGKPDVLAAMAGTLLPLLLFFTFQQLGTLASSIAEHLSFTFTPTESEDEAESQDESS